MAEYKWVDNPTLSGISKCDTDVLNDDLMYLKTRFDDFVEAPFVNKNGDTTLSGNYQINGGKIVISNPAGSPFQITTKAINKQTVGSQVTVYDNTSTTAPTANNYIQRYRGYDKNGKEVGSFETVHDTSNNVRSIIRTNRIISGATKTANLDIGVKANGNRYARFLVDEFIINEKYVPYVTERVVSGTSYYEIWSDGWIRQGGVITMAGDSVATVYFLKKYSNTNYGLDACLRSDFNQNGDAGINAYPSSTDHCQIKNGAEGSEFAITWEAWGK